jgi:hypothetical protein
MIEDPPFEPDPALVDRWRRAVAAPVGAAPDALVLAAYAEGRSSDLEIEEVEAALAADPALLDTLLALGRPVQPVIASAAFIGSVQGLVPVGTSPVVVPFFFFRPRPAAAGSRARVSPALAWAAVAASLLLVSVAGFDLGMRTERLVNAADTFESPGDLLDPSSLPGDDIG